MTIKTLALTGAEISANGLDGCNAAIRNDSTEAIYVSKKPGITIGAEGVLSIPAGGSAAIFGISRTIYILGRGSAIVVSSDYNENPFKSAAQGGSGADDVARAAITTHAGNADIHVTAAEKAGWNNKAELSDIPPSLPANGGNSDTIDGKHADEFIYARGYFDSIDLNEIRYPCSGLATGCSNAPTDKMWGTLIVFAGGTGSFTQIYVVATLEGVPSDVWIRQYPLANNQLEWTPWRNTADGGNAALVGNHPSSDFVLKSDYDALVERVVTLESN